MVFFLVNHDRKGLHVSHYSGDTKKAPGTGAFIDRHAGERLRYLLVVEDPELLVELAPLSVAGVPLPAAIGLNPPATV